MLRVALYSLEERLADDLESTHGTMPIDVVVADEPERRAALKWLKGRRRANLLNILTKDESAAADKERRSLMKPKPRPKRVVL